MGNVLVVCFWSPAHRCAGLGGAPPSGRGRVAQTSGSLDPGMSGIPNLMHSRCAIGQTRACLSILCTTTTTSPFGALWLLWWRGTGSFCWHPQTTLIFHHLFKMVSLWPLPLGQTRHHHHHHATSVAFWLKSNLVPRTQSSSAVLLSCRVRAVSSAMCCWFTAFRVVSQRRWNL